jgi:putative ABC transport system permease protein
VPLPPPGWRPAVEGVVAGFVLLLGFALPPLLSLGRVSALRVLRRDLGAPTLPASLTHGAGIAAVAAFVLWHTRDARMAAWVLAGIGVAAAVSALVAFGMVRVAARAGARAGFAWRFGLANLSRRAGASVIQVVALGAGLLALILLSITRGDLLESWRGSLPADAPNRFLVNIQPDQVAPLEAFFVESGRAAPRFHPMVRARLTEINGRAVTSANYTDDRARRLVDREFNLSWAARPQDDNVILAGRWWTKTRPEAQFSFESGIAETLGVKLGDVLAYDVAGTRLEAPVTSLRKVQWDSFRVNFFVVAPPGSLDDYPATWVTSFHLPRGEDALMDRLVKRFPNLLVIDVAAVLGQVQTMMEQVVRAVEFLFLFGLGAGLLVLLAALQTTHDERRQEAALLRALGARSRQIGFIQAAEFVVVGGLAGTFAALGASAVGWLLAREVLQVPYAPDPWLWLAGPVVGAVGVVAAGMLGTAGLMRAQPMEVLRRG